MTAASPKTVVRTWVDAFNRGDVDGTIRFQRGYWDRLSFLRQQGLPLPTK